MSDEEGGHFESQDFRQEVNDPSKRKLGDNAKSSGNTGYDYYYGVDDDDNDDKKGFDEYNDDDEKESNGDYDEKQNYDDDDDKEFDKSGLSQGVSYLAKEDEADDEQIVDEDYGVGSGGCDDDDDDDDDNAQEQSEDYAEESVQEENEISESSSEHHDHRYQHRHHHHHPQNQESRTPAASFVVLENCSSTNSIKIGDEVFHEEEEEEEEEKEKEEDRKQEIEEGGVDVAVAEGAPAPKGKPRSSSRDEVFHRVSKVDDSNPDDRKLDNPDSVDLPDITREPRLSIPRAVDVSQVGDDCSGPASPRENPAPRLGRARVDPARPGNSSDPFKLKDVFIIPKNRAIEIKEKIEKGVLSDSDHDSISNNNIREGGQKLPPQQNRKRMADEWLTKIKSNPKLLPPGESKVHGFAIGSTLIDIWKRREEAAITGVEDSKSRTEVGMEERREIFDRPERDFGNSEGHNPPKRTPSYRSYIKNGGTTPNVVTFTKRGVKTDTKVNLTGSCSSGHFKSDPYRGIDRYGLIKMLDDLKTRVAELHEENCRLRSLKDADQMQENRSPGLNEVPY